MSKTNPIIIVEDDLDDQDVMRDVFKDLEVKNELHFFDKCEAAFDHLLAIVEKPFLILCDINLPKMNGIELKRKIDANDFLRKKAIPFIFLTTADDEKTVEEAYKATNLQGYFRKGQTLQEIKEKVRCILSYWTTAIHPKGA